MDILDSLCLEKDCVGGLPLVWCCQFFTTGEELTDHVKFKRAFIFVDLGVAGVHVPYPTIKVEIGG